MVRTPPCHGGGRGFESHPGRHYADLAHLVERHLAKVEVASSSLVIRSTIRRDNSLGVFFMFSDNENRTTAELLLCGLVFGILKAEITMFTSVYAVLGAHLTERKKGVKRFYIAASRYLPISVAQI